MIRWHPDVVQHLVPIDSVHQLPGNYRNGDVEALMESIRVNGFFTSTLANRRTGNLLIGNHRYAALLGLGSDQIPVMWTDVSDAEEMRIAVADNRLSDLARNDPGLLSTMLGVLSETEIGLLGTGWTEEEYAHLLTENEPDMPEGEGFGIAVNGIYQVVIECDTEDAMNEVFTVCTDRGWTARKVVL